MGKGLRGKRIVVGISGSIAAYKVAGWVSSMAKEEAQVSVIMTDAAQKFISPLTFSALTGEKTHTAMFDGDLDMAMTHIEVAQNADIFLVAPASAQTIARLANGMADDLLSTTILAAKVPVIICPAMNSAMYLHPATQENLQRLKTFGYIIINPDSGIMACKDEGPGRLVEWEKAEDVLHRFLSENDLKGKKVLVTAGPTREALDPARFISNRSSGKMGYSLARASWRRGAEVILVSGPSSLTPSAYVMTKKVTSAQEMYESVIEEFADVDIVIKAAAVSDFRPQKAYKHKVKKEQAEESIGLERNIDILKTLGERKKDQILVGFAAETDDIINEARKKLEKKNLDMIVVNQINSAESGFEADTNRVVIVDEDGDNELPLCSKDEAADMILDEVVRKHLHR